MYMYYKQRLWHAIRFRNKRGYGVHSPYMFNLILNVLRDKKHIYKYPSNADELCSKQHKRDLYRLIFRLCNFLDVKEISCYCCSSCDILSAYVNDCVNQIHHNDFSHISSSDMIIISGEKINELHKHDRDFWVEIGKKRQCVILTDIYSRKDSNVLWKQLCKNAKVNVDMMWYGILLFDNNIQPGKYNMIL